MPKKKADSLQRFFNKRLGIVKSKLQNTGTFREDAPHGFRGDWQAIPNHISRHELLQGEMEVRK